jgi:hypothetical protein
MEIGDKVYLLKINDNARYYRYHDDDAINYIQEDIVAKVGRKYFGLTNHSREKFSLETMSDIVTCGSSDWAVYMSVQEIYDEKEKSTLEREVGKVFDWSSRKKLSLNQLRRIKAIIDEA